MNSVFAVLRRHRHAKLHSRAWCRGDITLHCLPFEGQKIIGPRTSEAHWVFSVLLHKRFFSTGFSSIHCERPSAEYAKLRKQSLEDEFGHVLGTYSSRSFSAVYRFGPFLALYRAAVISYHVLKLSIWQLFVHDVKKRAIKVVYFAFGSSNSCFISED